MGDRRRRALPAGRVLPAALVAAAVTAATLAAPAGAQTPSTPPTPPPGTGQGPRPTTAPTPTALGDPIAPDAAPLPVLDSPRSAPTLAAVAVSGAGYDRALAAHRAALDEHARAVDAARAVVRDIEAAMGRERGATGRYDGAADRLRQLEATRVQVAEQRIAAARRQEKAVTRIDEIRTRLRDLAVNEYVTGGRGGSPEEQLDLEKANGLLARRVVIDAVQGDNRAELAETVAFRDQQGALVTTLTAELDELGRRIATATGEREQAVADRDRAVADQRRLVGDLQRANATIETRRGDVDARRRDLADARLTATVVGLDVPFVVLNAYVRAADRLAVEKPSCGLRWTALAGIGRTESNHGTFGGSVVTADGEMTRDILGVSLDGSGGNADLGGDRAQGPMQFITSTWAAVGRDGNGDGVEDVQNYYDAALSAADYLCRKGPGLNADEGLRRGFFSYNQDSSYVELVLSRSKGYDRFRLPPVDAAATAEAKTPPVTVVPPPVGAAGA